MAVRHDVENLIRRGNIFYWRARVPTRLAPCRPGSRLSLSLPCSDHKKAQVIGRKLNMLMAELKMKSKDPCPSSSSRTCGNTSATSCFCISRALTPKPLKSSENPRPRPPRQPQSKPATPSSNLTTLSRNLTGFTARCHVLHVAGRSFPLFRCRNLRSQEN